MSESWQYLDQWQGKDTCIFALSLSPAQEFIEEARKSRDLRAGSLLLSWLSFKLYEPILQHYQEKAFIVPACAGNSFFEAWRGNGKSLEIEHLKAKELFLGGKSITNRAVGLIEREQLCLLKEAEENCRAAWNSYAAFCLQDEKLNKMPSAWRERWQQQMQDFSAAFSSYAVAADANLNDLPGSIQKIIDQMERRKDSRLFKQWPGNDMPKCTQCGHREILSGKEDSFWKRFQSVIRIEGGRELLCACCLAKRLFAFCDKVFPPSEAVDSTIDIAAAPFLDEFSKLAQENSESFQLVMECWSDDVQQHVPSFLRSKPFTDDAWLKKIAELVLPYELEDNCRRIVEAANRKYLHSPPENGLGLAPPSPYLAVLMLDGDKMGEHLSKHPQLSNALTEFSQAVPEIIKRHQGTAIYSSGDELLALLPKNSALSATQAVQKKFTDCIKKVAEHIEEEVTCSASITWFHCKDPLQQAIKNCREGLMLAKDGFNRNSFVCTVLTNSASEYRSGSPWSFDATQVADELIKLICLLRPDGGLSKNFLHDLLAELPSFGAELAADQDLLSPRLRYLWKRHTKEETAARCACEDRCRFFESMASSLPGVNNTTENFAACLRVVGFLARN
jgi:CRISPR-associated protein Cmr2